MTTRSPARSARRLVQLANASPAPSAGTSPAATAPIAAPRKNGVITEESAKVAPEQRASPIVAASPRSAKARAAQDDPHAGEEERDVERLHDRRERRREAGPHDDEDEDQPDVVRLPDRAHRALDHPADPRAPLGAARGEVPEAGAEVGAAEDGVRGEADDQDGCAELGEHQGSTSMPAPCAKLGLGALAARCAAGAHRRTA